MNNKITFSDHDDHLLVSISDEVITAERAQEILAQVGERCTNSNYTKVLLNEMSVVRRDVHPKQIEKLAFNFKKNKLNKVYIAFLCQSHLVGYDTNLLSLYTYKAEFIVQHFTTEEKAVDWLNSK